MATPEHPRSPAMHAGRGRAYLDDRAGGGPGKVWAGENGMRSRPGRGALTRRAHDAHHLVHRGFKARLLEAALPDDEHRPAVGREKLAVTLVASAVARELGQPEVHV